MTRPRSALHEIKPYIPGKPVEELKRELGLDDVIKLASNENPYGPSPQAVQAITESLDDLRLYPDGNCTLLKTRLAEHFDLQPEHVVVGNGSDGILKLLGEAFLEPGDRTVFAWPSFVEYKFVSQLMGAEMEAVRLDDDLRHDLGAMAEAACRPGVKLVFICNPNNPTGTIVTRKELDRFLDAVPDEVLVVLDEAYNEYVEEPDYPQGVDVLREGRNVIVLRTFSKIYGLAALRIGYGLSDPGIIGHIHKAREPFNTNRPAQVAAVASLDDANHVEECRMLNTGGLKMLYQAFERLGLDYIPSQANFVLVKVPVDTSKLFQRLLERGIIIRPGVNLGLPEHIRVTVGRPAENRRFVSALEEVLKAMGR